MIKKIKEQLVYEVIKRRVAMKHPPFGAGEHMLLMRQDDYVRRCSILLALKSVVHEPVTGSLAEAGVYRGDTSQLIHDGAPERRLYLFDTFEGFPVSDLEGRSDGRFNDTNEQLVRRKLGDSPNVVIRKGYVPDTFTGLEHERFAFVLLDLDLYLPTKSSLDFFYPRLNRGAYLMVHDYNSLESSGACKKAVNEFMSDKPERIVELSDVYGSMLIRKI